jgi:hypothetical protein
MLVFLCENKQCLLVPFFFREEEHVYYIIKVNMAHMSSDGFQPLWAQNRHIRDLHIFASAGVFATCQSRQGKMCELNSIREGNRKGNKTKNISSAQNHGQKVPKLEHFQED